ncbi:jg23835 [Pararge aegeria aegeria]|uniref:Jg23835 protein n=1 Tax=Pararge aegeria aegeria TaxID=348720 RepID=A0A8S4QXI3_9NEOP|nr:jg23835 [Pararge aegeria aegeria]
MIEYQPSSLSLFEDDPGVMSEVETSSTGFRRGGKQRSSLPVVRTPSKTLERPLGLVFLQYRSETKRALLPNEITSIDTVKALFVRSFSKQLTMQYMDSAHVKIYIHDSSKDMFYELEDVRRYRVNNNGKEKGSKDTVEHLQITSNLIGLAILEREITNAFLQLEGKVQVDGE